MRKHHQLFRVKGNKHQIDLEFTREELIGVRNALQKVIPVIKKDPECYICIELMGLKGVSGFEVYKARQYVRASLNYQNTRQYGISTVHCWLEWKGIKRYSIRQVRLQFLKNMIAELNRALRL